MEALLETLKGCDLFSNFPEAAMEEFVLPHRQLQRYRKDTVSYTHLRAHET